LLIDVPEWRLDVLQEHCDEIESLLNRRLRSDRSPDLDAISLERIDTRLDAHVDAVVLADEHAWPLVERALGSGEVLPVASAGLAIASTIAADAWYERLAETLATSTGPVLVGLQAALALRAGARLRDALATLDDAAPPIASAACFIAAAHDPQAARRAQTSWRRSEDPRVRRSAWGIETRMARHERTRIGDGEWQEGFSDADAGVRRAALCAAARSGHRLLLDHLRAVAQRPHSGADDELWLLATLGGASDVPLLLEIVRAKIPGAGRFRILSALGCAPAVEELLGLMRDGTPLEGALAADAFFRITGVRADLPERIPFVAPDAVPDELADEVRAGDPEVASRAWSAVKGRMSSGRWVRGLEVDNLSVDRLPKELDLEARWGIQLRAAATRSIEALAWDAERFPFG
jgi:hypothetical protein